MQETYQVIQRNWDENNQAKMQESKIKLMKNWLHMWKHKNKIKKGVPMS